MAERSFTATIPSTVRPVVIGNWTQDSESKLISHSNPSSDLQRGVTGRFDHVRFYKKVLSKYLGVGESFILPVISFVGDVELKTELPSNVLTSRVSSYIKRFNEEVFSNDEVERITGLLSNVKSEYNISKKDHIQSLEDRYSSDTICPKCGSNLVLREVKQGSRRGSQFLGCSSFPRCRFTKQIQLEQPSNFIIIGIVLIIIFIFLIFSF